jgi:hypothetical protein
VKIIATYAFLPWLRQGVANTIATADGDASVKTRGSIDVSLAIAGDPIAGGAELSQTLTQKVALYGPGDIVGIDARAVVRTEPRAWITNFEANYLPAIDFYDEDFPWRYTPAAASEGGLRLRPWIALTALTELEFTEKPNAGDRPLPFITVADSRLLPPASELWAWAHVHFNQSLSGDPKVLVSPDMGGVLPRVRSIIQGNPDQAYSRLMCPRRLLDTTGYHAFVIPVFETGRLAGLGYDPSVAPHATFSAWDSYPGKPEPGNYPIYYRWYFRTATHGDFEYLVRLLKPQPVDPRVGTRDMDVQDPGSNLPGIRDADLKGVLKLGGALRVPDDDLDDAALAERKKYENWDQPYPHPFEAALAKFINLPDDYSVQPSQAANAASALGAGIDDDPDPLITAPLYGRWHALTQRLLFDRAGAALPNADNWVHRLNLDPRFRVPAAFGTDVVETNAEEYMNDAWEQIGDVLAVNSRIRRLLLAREISWRWHETVMKPMAALNPQRAFSVMAPVASRVIGSPTTIAYLQSTSRVPVTYTSAAMRRVIRPGSRLMRALPFTPAITADNLLDRVNEGTVSAAPPVVLPPSVPTVDEVASAATPPGVPAWILRLLQRYPWIPRLVFWLAILGLLLALVPGLGILLAAVVFVGGLLLYRLLSRWQTLGGASQILQPQNQIPSAVDALPKSPDFTLTAPGSVSVPTIGNIDSPVAARFKSALRDSFTLLATTRTVSARPAPVALDIKTLTYKMLAAIDPLTAIPRRARTMIDIPARILAVLSDDFGEVMHYPRIDVPMYSLLKPEKLLPNLNLIPSNSITLIETHQRFIESYMVGLNHEFARKLLWREYPTDQRGSYFRQFWDTRGCLNTNNLPADQFRENLYDIPELHRWSPTSALGDHNQRATPGKKGEEAVLVIRGELLKRYPTAVIYAHRAQWPILNGQIDLTQPRSLQDVDAAFENNPPPTIVKTPLYEAKVDPDLYFFGFDLTIEEAKGGPGTDIHDDPGWFFVIKERPGEPRFGLELSRSGTLEVFDELTWDDPSPAVAPGGFLGPLSLGSVALQPPVVKDPTEEDAEHKKDQHDDDEQVNSAAVSSARWAYLLFRQPVMIAIHASEMLRKQPQP